MLPGGDIDADERGRTRFSLAFRGHRMSEVAAILDRLARQLDTPVEEEAAEAAPETGPPVSPRVRGEDHTA